MSKEAKKVFNVSEMMIIGKYFKSKKDYVNVMCINSKFHELVAMYHFNPIGECSLFENMETQFFYSKQDLKYRREGMYKYVHTYPMTYNECKKGNQEDKYRCVKLKSQDVNVRSPVIPSVATIIDDGLFLRRLNKV